MVHVWLSLYFLLFSFALSSFCNSFFSCSAYKTVSFCWLMWQFSIKVQPLYPLQLPSPHLFLPSCCHLFSLFFSSFFFLTSQAFASHFNPFLNSWTFTAPPTWQQLSFLSSFCLLFHQPNSPSPPLISFCVLVMVSPPSLCLSPVTLVLSVMSCPVCGCHPGHN